MQFSRKELRVGTLFHAIFKKGTELNIVSCNFQERNSELNVVSCNIQERN
jgi:hypothetical protein